jgi:hypothetical protein
VDNNLEAINEALEKAKENKDKQKHHWSC